MKKGMSKLGKTAITVISFLIGWAVVAAITGNVIGAPISPNSLSIIYLLIAPIRKKPKIINITAWPLPNL